MRCFGEFLDFLELFNRSDSFGLAGNSRPRHRIFRPAISHYIFKNLNEITLFATKPHFKGLGQIITNQYHKVTKLRGQKFNHANI